MKKVIFLGLTLLFNIGGFSQTLQDAQSDIDNESYFKAKVILLKLLNDPNVNKAEVAYYLGNAYLKSDEADSAKIFYKMVYNPENGTAFGHVANGRLALLTKNMDVAKAEFERALKLSKYKNANVYYEVGDAYFRPNIIDLQLAISNFEEAYNLDNKNTAILLSLGDAYLENSVNDPSMGGKAMNKYEAATDLNKNLAMAWIKIGRLDMRGHIYDQAIDAFNKALKIDKNFPLIHKELGEAYYYTKQYQKSQDEFKTYVSLSPGDTKARNSLLEMYFENQAYDKVADEAAKGLKSDSNNVDFLRFLIYSDYELKRYKDGYDVMKRYFALPGAKPKPRDYIYAARLANAPGINDTTLTLSLFPQALAQDSTNCDLIGEYAKALYVIRHFDDATKQYENKRQKCGNLTSLDIYYLGRAYLIVDDSIKADTTFGEFIQRNPTSPDGYFWRARTDLKLGQLEDFLSMPYYQKYIELVSPDPGKNKDNLVEAYDYMGGYYLEKEKDKEKAIEMFQKAKELNTDDEIANESLKQLGVK